MSEDRSGEEIRTEPPRALPPPVPARRPPLQRLLRGALIGLASGAFIGVLQGGAMAMLMTHGSNLKTVQAPATRDLILYVLNQTLVFGALGALLVGLSQLVFGGWTGKDRDSKP